MTKRARVLVVDDEASMREMLQIVLGNAGYDVDLVGSVHEAQDFLGRQAAEVVLTDLRMGNDRGAGMKLLSWMGQHHPATPIIMMTAYGSVETATEAMRLGATDCLMKPFKNDEVRIVVRRALDAHEGIPERAVSRKEEAVRGSLDNIIGASRAIEEVCEMIGRVAPLNSTVIIYGESGTGKELVARGIHQLSSRSDKPIVFLNCGAFAENLLESELFGYKKGAFTGAVADKEGLFVVANGGTMFLDEIGDMPLALQVKLLRVLDTGLVMPVGGTTRTQVDVRIISATNRDLDRMVREGAFREDLFYRLNVIPITVAPLRERGGDIPVLARHFVGNHAAKMGCPAPALSAEAVQALCSFNWPGNVRELENVMERAVALCSGDRIEAADLPPQVRNYVAAPASDLTKLPPGGLDLEAHIASIEISLIQQALQNSKYSHKRAAELLGLSSRSLRYRLQKYNLGEP